MQETVYGVYNKEVNKFVSEIYKSKEVAYDFLKYVVGTPDLCIVIPLTYTKPKEKIHMWGLYNINEDKMTGLKFTAKEQAEKYRELLPIPSDYQVFSFTVEV
jgi:hypothetical protein